MNAQRKRLLILGAGRGQIGLYKAAREMGVISIAGTMPNNNPPCIPLADEVCYMDILDPDEVESKTADLRFDGVATCCLDRGLKALGRLCDKRSLPGYSEEVAELCNDKSKMKLRFSKYGVNTAAIKQISSDEDLLDAIDKIGGYPVIIKATDLAGSRGIYKANNEEEAFEGFYKAKNVTKVDYVLIEKFLQGREFGAQAFISNGEILFVMPHGDILYQADTAVPVGHYVPYECSDVLREKMTEEARKAIKAIGLDDCAVNIDFIEEDGVIYVLELTGRIGANCLPELVSINYGLNYYKMVIAAALGIDPVEIWNQRQVGQAGLSKMIISPEQEGVLEDIRYVGERDSYIYDLTFFVRPGSEVKRFANSSHCLAQIVVEGQNLEECERKVDLVTSKIEMRLK